MSKVVTVLKVNEFEDNHEMVNYHGTFSIKGDFPDGEGAQLTLNHTFNIHLLFRADTGVMLRVCLYQTTNGTEGKAWASIIGDMEEWKEQGTRSSRDIRMVSQHSKPYDTVNWAVLTLVFKLYHALVNPTSNKIRDGRFEYTQHAWDDWLVKAMYKELQG